METLHSVDMVQQLATNPFPLWYLSTCWKY